MRSCQRAAVVDIANILQHKSAQLLLLLYVTKRQMRLDCCEFQMFCFVEYDELVDDVVVILALVLDVVFLFCKTRNPKKDFLKAQQQNSVLFLSQFTIQ